jgi:hypothetical protein
LNASKIFYLIVFGICAVVLIYSGVRKVRNVACANNFGRELNQKRRSLHIPIIPASWQVKQKDDNFTLWTPNGNIVKGHGYKGVSYDGCELNEEDDHYYFDSKKVHDTILEIEYRYINSKRKRDSTIFIFQIGHHADTISKKMADSILMANKTQLD